MSLTIKVSGINAEIPAGWYVIRSGQVHWGDKYYHDREHKFVDVPSPNVGQPVGRYPLIIRKPFPSK